MKNEMVEKNKALLAMFTALLAMFTALLAVKLIYYKFSQTELTLLQTRLLNFFLNFTACFVSLNVLASSWAVKYFAHRNERLVQRWRRALCVSKYDFNFLENKDAVALFKIAQKLYKLTGY